MRSAYYEVLRNLVFRSIQRETRLSERQVAQLRWEQVRGDKIETKYHREVQMSRELVAALDLLPHSGGLGYVFVGTTLSRQHSPEMEELRARFAAEDAGKTRRKPNIFRLIGGRAGLTKA